MKRLNNPSATTVKYKGLRFFVALESLKNDINGNGRKKVIVIYQSKLEALGYTYTNARAYTVKANQRTDEEIAKDTVREMVEEWKR